jgi:hypothetical protein
MGHFGFRLTRFGSIAALIVVALVLLHAPLFAQVASGSLSGTVVDATGAVIPKADIALTNEATRVTRHSVSNESGVFNIVAIPPGTYTVTISAPGFANWSVKDIVFSQGENRTLAHIAMNVGGQEQAITVEAAADDVPVTTGETRETLNQNMISNIAITGRDAAELIRLMPGMGMNNGLSQKQWNSEVTGTNSGPIGNFSANGGTPYGGMTMTTDGANIVDVGNQGAQISNINQDQTAEVTLLNSAYGAEYAKGPVVFQAIGKSGGSAFHGSGYLYARNGIFNSEDWNLKRQQVSANLPVKKPDDHYYYPGFTLGGPVIIPGTGLNKKHDKLFFFTGYELMKQQPAGTNHRLVVPTEEMRKGDFSGVGGLNGLAGKMPCFDAANMWQSWCKSTQGLLVQNGIIPQSLWDSNGMALMKMLPLPNQQVDADGYNYHFLDAPPTNRWEYRLKVDYNISEKHHLSGSWTKQNETDVNNFGVWWEPPATVPYPTSLPAATRSNVLSFNLTSTFTPTLTNELIFSYAKFVNPVRPSNKSVVDPANVGFTAPLPFQANIMPMIPNTVTWGSCNNWSNGTEGCFPGFYAPGFASDFYNGAFGKRADMPSITENISKVIGSHTMKFGMYWDLSRNLQPSGYGNWAQGMYEFEDWHNGTTGNLIADMLIGHASGFSQVSNVPTFDQRFHQYAFYAQDMWRATRRLTLTYGLRFDHEGQWYVANKDYPGLAVWDQNKYDNTPNATPLSGMSWHAIDKSVPVSGFESPLFHYNPRVGVAYDLFGNGKTIFRGGFGVYSFQFSGNDIGSAQMQGLGVKSVGTPELNSLAEAGNYTPAPGSAFNGNQFLILRGDNRTPHTQNWNFTVSQAVPWKSIVEITYSGSRARDMLLTGNGGNMNFIANINKIPFGAFFQPDPVTGTTYTQTGSSCAPYCGVATGAVPSGNGYGSGQTVDYRPFVNYGDALALITHGSYSNYNAMQAQWRKQTGIVTFIANYTFSKVLGIRDGQTNNGNGSGTTVQPFDARANYGPLAYDHTHIFNVSYVVSTPKLAVANKFLSGTVNGWTFSGVSQIQSGAPLQPNTGGHMNVSFSGDYITNSSILGTNAMPLLPVLTCDPRSGLASGQYFNPNCFTGPQQGQIGNTVWPYIRGPKYMSNDLSLYKDFHVTERQRVQFRINAFNVFNHALKQFGLGNDVNLNLKGTRDRNNFFGPIAYTQTNADFTGVPKYKVGRRMLELAIKYEF